MWPSSREYEDGIRAKYGHARQLWRLHVRRAGSVEDAALNTLQAPGVYSLRSAFAAMFMGRRQVAVIRVAALSGGLQKTVVSLVLDHLRQSCDTQARAYAADPDSIVPVYPTVFCEEAHLYMDDEEITTLASIIRHVGISLFFVSNTPSALPPAVFRLVDNVIIL